MFAQYSIFLGILIVVLCAVLNRVRGGGFYGDVLPGRALLWVAPLIGGLAVLANPIPVTLFGSTQTWYVGAAFGLGYLFWGLWSWGYAFAGLGGVKPTRDPSVLEAFLLLFGPSVAQTFVRHMFVLAGVAAVAWLIGSWWFLIAAPIFAAAATAIYTALFRPLGALDWTRAEIATGALWGVLILSPSLMYR